jgi:hypothetical protein
MHISKAAIWLSVVVVLLAIMAAGAGLFWRSSGEPFAFTTLRDQAVQIYNQGVYRYDTLFIGAGYKGQDLVVLFLGVPLLALSILLYSRRSIAGRLLLAGTLGYFLYVYASMALGAAYNRLFLLYVALFSASLFAFILAFSAFDLDLFATHLAGNIPRRGLGIFLLVSGLVTLIVWGAPLVASMINGSPPDRLDSYTTMVTYALDLAIITPSTLISGILILRSKPLGYLVSLPLLIIIIMLVPQIILSTVFQQSAGVPFTTGEMVGPVTGFVVLGLIAIWLLISLLRGLRPSHS